jgi:hypothetical protein
VTGGWNERWRTGAVHLKSAAAACRSDRGRRRCAGQYGTVTSLRECNRGIVIDEGCRTSLPDIYAAGDVTECRDVTLDRVMSSAIWPAARKQGRVAGINMAGGQASLQEHTGLRAVSCSASMVW